MLSLGRGFASADPNVTKLSSRGGIPLQSKWHFSEAKLMVSLTNNEEIQNKTVWKPPDFMLRKSIERIRGFARNLIIIS